MKRTLNPAPRAAIGLAVALGTFIVAGGAAQREQTSRNQSAKQLQEDVSQFGKIPPLTESKFNSLKFSTADAASKTTLTSWIDQVKLSHKALEGTKGDGPIWKQMYDYHSGRDDTTSASAKFAAQAVTTELGNSANDLTADDLIIYGKSLTTEEQRLFVDFLDGSSQDLRRTQLRAQSGTFLEQANVYLVKTELVLTAIKKGQSKGPAALLAGACGAVEPLSARHDVSFILAQSFGAATALTAEQAQAYRICYRFTYYNTSSDPAKWNYGQSAGTMPSGLFDVWVESREADGVAARRGPVISDVSPAGLFQAVILVIPPLTSPVEES